MEHGTAKLLEATTHRTLHAHGFSRTSNQAALTLTDLLTRYLTLLASTCAKYAEHAGRTRLSPSDIVSSMEELGLNVSELREYCSSEAKELARYGIRSTRRIEDMHEFQAHLSNGLKQDHDDAIRLNFRPNEDAIDVDSDDEATDEDLVMASPSPARKRLRSLDWDPPSHIPDFLPPFPTAGGPPSPTLPEPVRVPPPPMPVDLTRVDKPPTTGATATIDASAPITSTSASDYRVQVPYNESSLSDVPEWHLPSGPSFTDLTVPPAAELPNLRTDKALIEAYHHILTHPPTPNSINQANPARHRVAMALLSHTQVASRWDPPDTLFSNVAGNSPRVSAIGPCFAVPDTPAGVDLSKDMKLPGMPPRPVAADGSLSHLVGQQTSRIPDLARAVLPPTILTRTSRLTHPPVLALESGKLLTYGKGVPAPWNASAAEAGMTVNGGAASKPKAELNGLSSLGKDASKPVLPDAKLVATWAYEEKSYRHPLNTMKQRKSGTKAGNATTISIPIAGVRNRAGSKVA